MGGGRPGHQLGSPTMSPREDIRKRWDEAAEQRRRDKEGWQEERRVARTKREQTQPWPLWGQAIAALVALVILVAIIRITS